MRKLSFEAVIFDLDGVITKTALTHAKAWKQVFDEYLRLRQKRDGEPFVEFSHNKDYLPFVDGKPRYDGVKSFLESRKINIPLGNPSDSNDKETICGIGNKKNALFLRFIKKDSCQVYNSSVEFIRKLKKRGIGIGVASSSKSCKVILESAGLLDLFETRVDGEVSAELGLQGKPEPDIFVKAVRNLGTFPANSVVVEDAISGVQAGRNGGFGLVIGLARKKNKNELLKNGADIAVSDLSEINIDWIENWFHKKPKPFCLKSFKSLLKEKIVFFFDYDGSLSPIVDKPELAFFPEDMRDILNKISEKYTTAIVSGRMREDVEKLVGIQGIFYVGSHGFDIKGPQLSMIHPKAEEFIPLISKIVIGLKNKLGDIKGILIEEKKFSAAVHYRLVKEENLAKIKQAVDKIVSDNNMLCLMSGKKVFEILPDINWDKGQAIKWILEALKLSWQKVSVVYIGDDLTDEYAFRMIRRRGVGILVSSEDKESAADFRIYSIQQIKELFKKILS